MFDWSKYAVGGAKRPDSFTGLNPNFSTALSQMLQAAEAELGQNALSITSAYRSPEKQAELYQAALKKYGSPAAARKWVAPPGRSMHNKGLAVDFGAAGGGLLRDPNSREAQWLKANASRFGLDVPMSWEPWQVELAGARKGKKIAAETMSLLGKGPQTSTKGPQMMQQEQKPRGLLEGFGVQKMEEGAEGETGQRFYQRDSFKDTAALLAQGFGRMGIMGMEEIADNIANQRTENKAKNKTVEFLRKSGRTDLADAVANNVLGARDAASMMFAKPKDERTTLQKNYEFYVAQGMAPEEAMQAVRSGPIINTGDQVDAEGKLREKLMAKRGESFASYLDAGAASASAIRDLNVLQELSTYAPSGPLEGRFAEAFPEFNDVAALRQSITKRVAPTLRVEGSGATSDLEFNAMLNSLGSLRNTPEANQAIIGVMQEKARYNMQRREIINGYMTNGVTLQATNEKLAALDASSAIPAAVESILGRYSDGETKSADSGGMNREDALKVLGEE